MATALQNFNLNQIKNKKDVIKKRLSFLKSFLRLLKLYNLE